MHIFGKTFYESGNKQMKNFNVSFLLQGTK